MLKVYACLPGQHDLRLVALAVMVCLLSSSTTVPLLARVATTSGAHRFGWLAVAATVSGIGVWATHFIALLAYRPELPSGYSAGDTLASLVVVVVLLGLAFRLAASRRIRHSAALGGAMVGAAVGAMHYIGMAGFRTEGRLTWDPAMVAISVILGMALGALALAVARRATSRARQAAGAILLTAAVCGLHFTAMAACAIIPDPTVALSDTIVSSGRLASWVAGAATLLLLLSASALLIAQQRRRAEARQLHELANAAIEGLAICEGGRIVTANASLAKLLDLRASELVGRSFAELLENPAMPQATGEWLEGRIRAKAGTLIPVELITHGLSSAGAPRLVVALRDLRDRLAAEDRMRHLAHHDGLTDLLNRLSFHEQLERQLSRHRREEDRLALLCLDLDRFKQVNDMLGHAAGDFVLQTVAARIAATLGEQDVFARLGGDEFAIMRPDACR